MAVQKPGRGAVTRRSALRIAACVVGGGALESTVKASRDAAERDTRPPDDTVLGGFEDGLDGWTSARNVELEHISETDVPVGVSSGSHALAAEVQTDGTAVIANDRRVRSADFVANPYLGMHVHGFAVGTDADLLFQFRLHALPGFGDDGFAAFPVSRWTRRSITSVWTSEWKPATQLRPKELQWDMTDVPPAVLEHPTRLEIAWQPDAPTSDSDTERDASGDAPFRGMVAFDEIRLYDAPPISPIERLHDKEMGLHRKHGMIVDREIVEHRKGFERGFVEYVDGTNLSYSFEVLDDGEYRYVIDGETFVIGGTNGTTP